MKRKIVSGLMLTMLFVGMLTLAFNIQPVKASETIYIRADGSVDPPTAPISTADNITYTLTDSIVGDVSEWASAFVVERDDIVIDGAGYTLEGGIGSGIGISLSRRSNVTIENIQIRNFLRGMYLDGSFNNVVSGSNIIAKNLRGVELSSSFNNTISGNNITNNTFCGIFFWQSENNTISENDIINNGEDLGPGRAPAGIWIGESSNNRIYHNNFIDNIQQVHIEGFGYVNIWDDGLRGNYWSDYTGEDADGDGIGDNPYMIPYMNQDNYPLMTPWALPPAHELVNSVAAPTYLQLGSSSSLNATVTNQGQNDETNVELVLLINGTTVDSTAIPLLQLGRSYTLSYIWTPTVEGTYNVTAYAHPVPDETSVDNNQNTKFVTVAVPVPPTPPEVQVGVKAGDWIRIDYIITGAPSGTPLPTWIKLEFLSVEGTNATLRVTMMTDGTEQSDTMTIDIVAGGGAFGTLSGFVIPANSEVGDSIFMSGYGNVTISGETTRTYAGASRTVVYASFSQYGTQLTYYWDKGTGVIVEASTTSGGVTGTAKATETNMWEAQATPLWMLWWFWLIIAVVLLAVAGTVIFLKKRKPPTTPPLPSEGTDTIKIIDK